MSRLRSLGLAALLALAALAAPAQVVTVPAITGFATGSGSVTSAACSPSNGVTCSVTNAATTPTFAIGLGAITPTSVNGLTVSTTTGTLTVASAKTLTASNTLTLAGTDGTTYTLPTQNAKGVPWLGSSTFAGLQTCNGTYSGYKAYISDLGARGAEVYCDGTRWRAVGGRVLLAQMAAASSAIANTETIVVQGKVPAGFMAAGDVVSITEAATKSGTTDSCNFSVRAGTAGTTADTNLTPSVITTLSSANLSGNAWVEFALASVTSTQRLGVVSGSGYFASQNSTAAQTPVTISSATSNALWWSFGISSSGATNTCTVQSARVELITG